MSPISPKNTKKEETKMSLILRAEEEKKAQILAAKFNLPYVNLLRIPIEVDALSKIPESKARSGLFLPFEFQARKIGIASFDPENEILKEVIKELNNKGHKTEIFVCSMASLKRGLGEYKRIAGLQKQITKEIELSPEEVQEIENKLKEFESLAEKLNEAKKNTTLFIETLLASAFKFGASDIHIIPASDSIGIRYRIDGTMHTIFSIEKNFFNSVLSRIKLISELKINIHDVAQDGRFSINLGGKDIEIRVSMVPGEYGEDVVMRILDPQSLLSVEELGFHPWHKETLLHQMKKPLGMILTCGPTGSGKTTTLYACLRYAAKEDVKIITIEDPIEYHLDGVDQTQVEPEKGYDFASALRAAMRQDPDVILVGEIRDSETANTAVQASLTGHLVFSTLHTNDASGIVPRLLEMGIDSPTIASALNLAISQRLLRRVCKKCSEEISLPKEIADIIKKNLANFPIDYLPSIIVDGKNINLSNLKVFKANGCEECYNTGYHGRVGIYEMFKITPTIGEVITTSPSIFEMRKAIINEGMITMQQDGLLRAIEGITTLEELERVTGPLE